MKREVSNYFLVGLFTLVISVAAIFALIKMTGNQSDSVEYHSYYLNVTGLDYGTPVYFEGYRIGQIESIKPDLKSKKLRFKVSYSALKEWTIPKDSKAQIQSAGLLADMSINIKAGESEQHFNVGDEIPGIPPGDLFAQLAEVSDSITDITEDKIKPMLDTLSERLDSITEKIDQNLSPILENLNQSTEKMNNLMTSANALLSKENKDNIAAIIVNVKSISEEFISTVKGLDKSLKNVDLLITDAHKLINSDDSQLGNILQTASQTMLSLSNKMDSIINEIESASMNLNEATDLIRKDPSSLIFSKDAKIEDEDL